ncbi:MAG TPA: hypothetical protein VGE11_07290 [Pseudonocardia sp.]
MITRTSTRPVRDMTIITARVEARQVLGEAQFTGPLGAEHRADDRAPCPIKEVARLRIEGRPTPARG